MNRGRSGRVGTLTGASNIVRKHKPDYRIALYMGLLMMLGLVVMYAIGPQRAQVLNSAYGTDFYSATYFFGKQALSLLLALAVFIAVSKIPISWWQANAKRLFIGGIIASALLAIGGWFGLAFVQCSLGACRWFDLGPLGSIQPAEFLKFGLLIFGASFIAYRAKQGILNDPYKSLIPLAAILLTVAIFVIGIQEDMGTGLVMLAMMACMLLVGGVSLRAGAVILAGLTGLGLLMISSR